MYSGSGNQNVTTNVTTENYNPDFIIERKTAGLGLPDYSPTKSINEYIVGPKTGFPNPQKNVQTNPSNFANNSDPYSQNLRSQDGSSPYSDDSSVLTGTESYKLRETKEDIIIQSKSGNAVGFAESEEYIEMMNRKRQRSMILGDESETRVKGSYIQTFSDGNKATLLNANDQVLIFDANMDTHNLTQNINTAPPPSYVRLLNMLF